MRRSTQYLQYAERAIRVDVCAITDHIRTLDQRFRPRRTMARSFSSRKPISRSLP
ncbi:Uncharacterised protein [Mycobacteroides abscessus subsp. bolletii]|nr:Uncharacterised protein [Mycobacteroides abscessus subsp. bolletii]SKX09974.1 Uncharacterised protein [Mycobacteroides abscessus subsp. bolletii]